MRIKKEPRYTHQSAYKDYVELLGKNSTPLTFWEYDRAIKAFMHKLSRAIIVEQYEWKLPFGGGYLRISKQEKRNKAGVLVSRRFFWYWDKINEYTRIAKKRLWSFRATVGWKDRLIGERGLSNYYMQCKCNPKIPNYDVPIIDHRSKIRP